MRAYPLASENVAPYPCGYLTDDRHVCTCQPAAILRYRSRISGPLMDRIDLQVEVPAVPYEDLKAPRGTRDSATMRAGIVKVRAIQAERYKDASIRLNADLQGALLERWCTVGEAEHQFLEQAAPPGPLGPGVHARAAHRPHHRRHGGCRVH